MFLRRLTGVQKFILSATLVYAVVFLFVLFLHPGSERYYRAFYHLDSTEAKKWAVSGEFTYKGFFNFYQALAPIFAGLCTFLLARSVTPARRPGWFVISAACFFFTLGQLRWAYVETVLQQELVSPGLHDLGFVGSCLLLPLGVLLLFGSMRITGRARLIMDSAIAASSFGALSWYFVVHPLWNSNQNKPLINKVLLIIPPLTDVMALFCASVLVNAAFVGGTMKRSSWLLTIGLALLAFADSAYNYYALQESYQTGSWFDWTYSFGWLSIGWAALTPLLWPSTTEERTSQETVPKDLVSLPVTALNRSAFLRTFFQVVLPYGMSVVAFVFILAHDYGKDKKIDDFSVLILCGASVLLVILRQVFTLMDNQQLTQQLKAFNSTLEQKVAHRTEQLASLLHLTKSVNSTRQIDKVVSEGSQHTLHVLRADAVVVWASGGDRPEMSLPPRAYPESVKQQYPALIKFLTAHPAVTEPTFVPLSQISDGTPTARSTVNRGAVAPTLGATAPETDEKLLADLPGQCLIAPMLWQNKPIGMIAAICWQDEFEEDAPDLLESIGVEVGNALENARLYAAAIEAADHDPVTGLLNHRAVHQRLDEEFHRAQRLERPLSVIMMDLNNFKLFNDTYGHPVGDQVLKRVARALESETRKYDVLGRYGGDEFIAILPDTDEPLAMVMAQRLSDRMSREGFQRGNDPTTVPISLSFGVANYPEDSNNRFELVTIADRNLYTAKLSDNGIMGTTDTQRAHRALRTEGSFDVLDAMVTAVDNKDRYTRRHSEDVTEYALWIAEELGYSEGTQRVIRIGGLLHDVGKIGVPEEILRKPGRLSDDEYETMKRHTQLGALIVGGVSGMESIIDIVKSHHERWDGNGYPDHLAGEDIPLLGRLLAVADAFSAMTTERPYRKSLTWEYAVNEIRKNIGTQFDPEMARAFLSAAAKRQPSGSKMDALLAAQPLQMLPSGQEVGLSRMPLDRSDDPKHSATIRLAEDEDDDPGSMRSDLS